MDPVDEAIKFPLALPVSFLPFSFPRSVSLLLLVHTKNRSNSGGKREHLYGNRTSDRVAGGVREGQSLGQGLVALRGTKEIRIIVNN